MTVRKLIQKLSSFDPDACVVRISEKSGLLFPVEHISTVSPDTDRGFRGLMPQYVEMLRRAESDLAWCSLMPDGTDFGEKERYATLVEDLGRIIAMLRGEWSNAVLI